MNLPPSRQLVREGTSDLPVSGRSRGVGKWLFAGTALIALLGAFWHFTDPNNAPEAAILSALRNFTAANTARPGAPPAAPRPNNAAPVRVAEAVRRDMLVIRRTPGTVVANTIVQVTARVQGIIESANFKEGQFEIGRAHV